VVSCLFQWLILKSLRRGAVFQKIYELGPESHQSKAQTPSFGGVGIFLTVSFGLVLFQTFSMEVMWAYSVFSLFFVIGLLDDLMSLTKNKNAGFSARQKFLLQTIGASFFIFVFHILIMPLNLASVAVFIFLIVGSSNATNLTDGVDGLLSSLGVITLIGFSLLFFNSNGGLFFLCVIVGISLLSFLVFNRHPAKLFMGDTGSLALGALFASFTVLLNDPWPLLSFGGVYVIETLSVILQVASFKANKKRLFLMSPLHHHFELLGFSECKIVMIFSSIALILGGVYFL
jgi:phospho-N-acetylmuramoyl-pentapeptide-transferase